MSTPATTRSLSEEAAVAFRDYREGEPGRIADLVDLLTPPLWAIARSCGLSIGTSEDIVQAAWVKLVQHADAIRDEQAVFGWLLTTVRRDAWKIAAREIPDPFDEEPVSSKPAPEAEVEARDRAERLWRHVSALSPRCQALLRVVAYATAPDYAMISMALGMPVGSIGPTRGRCLATLRAALDNDPGWSDS